MASFKRDDNFVPVIGGVSSADSSATLPVTIDSATGRVLVQTTLSGQADGAITDGVSSTIKATVLDYTNSNPLAVRLTDTSGDYVSAGAGTQYTEGDTDATIVGSAVMMEGAANTLLPIQGTVADGLLVNLGANNDISGTVTANLSATDNAVLDAIELDTTDIKTALETAGGLVVNLGANNDVTVTGSLTSAGAVTNAGTFVVQENGAALTALQLIDNAVSGAGFNITQFNGAAVPIGAGLEATALRVTVATDSTGVLSVDDNGGALTVDGTVAVSSVGGTVAVTQSGTWDEVGINDSGNSITVDYATTGSGTATGALRVELPTNGTGVIATVGAVTAITNALPAGTNAIGKLAANSGVDIGDVDVTSIVPGTGATNLGKAEDGGHTTGDVGVFALGVRNDTLADVTGTTADYSQLSTDLKGRLMVGSAPRALKVHQITTITSSTSETTILTAVASTYLDVYGILATNTSATATEIHVKDSTAGTTRFTLSVPANDTRGFMLPVDAAIPASGTNANWTATCADSVASVIITILAVKNV